MLLEEEEHVAHILGNILTPRENSKNRHEFFLIGARMEVNPAVF